MLQCTIPMHSCTFFIPKTHSHRLLSTALHPLLLLDSYHYTRLLQSCTSPATLHQIHAQITTAGHAVNPFLASKLVSAYAALGSTPHARQVFDRAPHRDTFLYNVMIRAYAASGPPADAVAVYAQLRRTPNAPPNCYTYSFVAKACAALSDSRTGRAVHAHAARAGVDSTLFVGNALVSLYSKCGETETARRVFDSIQCKDIVTWNSIIAGYAQNHRPADAVAVLHQMLRGGNAAARPDRVTLVTLLPACAALADAPAGMWIHCHVIKTGMGVDPVLGSGLVGMYGSCGRLEVARRVFDGMPERNAVMCNAMIAAYGVHGRAAEALEIFELMLAAGIAPDGICFVSMLSACSHAGMVDKGREIFELMESYKVHKGQIHYACMVDVLGRSGRLQEAVEFIERMPVEPGRDVWGALLGACRIYNDVELAEVAAEKLFALDPENAGRYLALAKIYDDVGRPEDAARVRKAMKDRGVRKPLGCSMLEVDDEVHTFGVEDESHAMTDEIYVVLEQLQHAVEEIG